MKRRNVFVICAIILFSSFNSSFGNSKTNDVPAWSKGDRWIFDGEFSYEIEESPLFLNITGKLSELNFNVASEDEDIYYLDFNGSIELKLVANVEGGINITASLKNARVSGYAHFEKSNLGLNKFHINITGFLIISVAPVPLPFSASMIITFTPPYSFISFPISEGSIWYTLPSIMKIELGEDLIDFIETMAELMKKVLPSDMDEVVDEILNAIDEFFPLELPVGLQAVECKSHEYLTVKAGTYESYHLFSIGGFYAFYYIANVYFSPTAKNIIKMLLTDEEHLNFSVELVSSTYHQPGVPEKPERPSGKERVRIRKSYEYETYSIDPDNDKLQYGWDWNSDAIVDEWTGFYNSGEKAIISHKWDKRGSYEIRVRARDENGFESEWSDPLAISAPYIRAVYFNPILALLLNELFLHQKF
ncbi:MAG: hypothetical protein H5T45_00440 [Thermoplasmatales archaeon]|nr:hypothetical protein [Thermoplasmatales archaeon]